MHSLAVPPQGVSTAAVVVAHAEPPAAPVTPHIPEAVESVLAAMSLSPGATGATGVGLATDPEPPRISSTRGP